MPNMPPHRPLPNMPPVAPLPNIITSINMRSPDRSEVARKAKAMTPVMARELKRLMLMREGVLRMMLFHTKSLV